MNNEIDETQYNGEGETASDDGRELIYEGYCSPPQYVWKLHMIPERSA